MGYKSPLPYTLSILSGSGSPADSADYFFGFSTTFGAGTTALNRIYIPRTGLIRKCSVLTNAATTSGTGENIIMVIRVNDTTDYAFATVGVAGQIRFFENLALSIPVSAGDFVSIKMTTPAWVTNPDGFRIAGSMLIECE